MEKKHRPYLNITVVACLCLLCTLFFGCNSGNNSKKEGSISFNLEREDTFQTSSVQAKTKVSPRWLRYIVSLVLPDIATAELDCNGISTIEAFAYDSSGELVNSGGPWDCSRRQGHLDNIPLGSDYRVVATAQDEEGLELYRGEIDGLTVEEGKTTNAGDITMGRVHLYPLEISFDPNDIEAVWNEALARWQYDFKYIVDNPNDVPVEIIAFGQFNECLGDPNGCSYTPDQFEARMTGCNEVTTSIPAYGSACDLEWWTYGYADDGDVTGQYAVWYRGAQGDPQVALSEPLTLREPPALSVYYRDGDGDGYGDPLDYIESGSLPSGYVINNTDCDDTDSSVNPGAAEILNGKDDDCDGSVDEEYDIYYLDSDGDGYGNPLVSQELTSQPSGYVTDNTDCDDNDFDINPGATEIGGNNIDENCDGILFNIYYLDDDSDGYGNPNSFTEAESQQTGYVTDNSDCNDDDASVNPGATEIRGNDIDEDCDGIALPALNTYFQDADSDGYGNPNSSTEAESQPSGYVTDNTDCNDNNAEVNPGATEIGGNDIDENCDDILFNIYYLDGDGDGYGNPASSTEAASQPAGYETDNTDCNDNNGEVNPGATEIGGNDIDENCDGIIVNIYYLDFDSDGYGNYDSFTEAASQPPGYVTDNSDCNDNNAEVNPGATEIGGNNIDENCDGIIVNIYYPDIE